MPYQEEKQRRREIKLEFIAKEQQKFLESLPVKQEILLALFDFLYEKDAVNKCKYNFEMANSFLSNKGLNNDNIHNWLEENGAYCDCEILYNVVEKFED